MNRNVLVGSVVLIFLVVVSAGWYWWYSIPTPQVVYDNMAEKVGVSLIDEKPKLADVRVMNITYKDDVCIINELKFFEDITQNAVILMFSSINTTTIRKEQFEFGYDKLFVRIEENGEIYDNIVLYSSNRIISIYCEKGNEEYVSRWFVEKYN